MVDPNDVLESGVDFVFLDAFLVKRSWLFRCLVHEFGCDMRISWCLFYGFGIACGS